MADDTISAIGASSGGGKKKLSPKVQIADLPSDIFSVRFSLDNQLVAAGCGDGVIRVFNCTSTGRLLYTLDAEGRVSNMPVTCMRFRPDTPTSKIRNVLIAASAEGVLRHWHVTSSKCLHEITEVDNEIYALDYTLDGSMFVTAGKDTKIRVYDEATKGLMATLSGGSSDDAVGHSNRIFSAKFHPGDQNVLVTGGWDNTIQIWDVRVDHSIRSFFGPHVCGDAVDVHDNAILTGSWRADDAVQLWDFGTAKLIENIEWELEEHEEACLIYSAQFSSLDGAFFAAGGSGSNEARIFERATRKMIGKIDGLTKGVYSLDFAPNGQMIAVGGGDASLRVMEMRESRARAKRPSLAL